MKKNIILLGLLLVSIPAICQNSSNKGLELLGEGKIEEAEATLKNDLETNPKDLQVMIPLADIYSFQKKWDEAIDLYQTAVDLKPENSEYRFKLGGAYGMKALSVPRIQAVVYIGDIKSNLEKAASLNPKHIQARRALVELYAQLPGFLGGGIDKAQKYADELSELSTIDYYLAKGLIQKEDDNREKAKKLYEKAFQLKSASTFPQDKNSLNYELGKIAAKYNMNLLRGLSFLDAYIANYGYQDIYSLEWAYYIKAKILAELNKKEEALKAIDKSLTLKADFKEAQKEKERIESL